jgi:hypothetical protein
MSPQGTKLNKGRGKKGEGVKTDSEIFRDVGRSPGGQLKKGLAVVYGDFSGTKFIDLVPCLLNRILLAANGLCVAWGRWQESKLAFVR